MGTITLSDKPLTPEKRGRVKGSCEATAIKHHLDPLRLSRWIEGLLDQAEITSVSKSPTTNQTLSLDWQPDGEAFEPQPTHAGKFLVGPNRTHPIGAVFTSEWWHGGIRSRQLNGTLQSSNFVIHKPFLHLRLVGDEARVNLRVGDSVYAAPPLYNLLKKHVMLPSGTDRWVTLNVSQWQGRRAYLELEDRPRLDVLDVFRQSRPYAANGMIGVREVVAADDESPPGPIPDEIEFASWLENVEPNEFGQALRQAIEEWGTGPTDSQQARLFPIQPTQFNDIGPVMRAQWKFRQRGESGIAVGDLFPHIGSCADDLCVIRSMVSDFPEHTAANYLSHTGAGQQGRPAAGAWLSFGLRSDNDDLPGFMVISGGFVPVGGVDNYGNGYLPARHQGSVIQVKGDAIDNIHPADRDLEMQREKLAFVNRSDERLLARISHSDAVEAAIENQMLAFRMQSAVPELLDLGQESVTTKRLYGFEADSERTKLYARQCLVARRMVERGVRFVQLTQPVVPGETIRWDQHGDLVGGHASNARAVDQPIAGLLRDLKARGLLQETLVVWAGEFGRTPFSQRDGRDHHPFGFSIWLAGGGVRGGMIHGATDEYGYHVIEDRMHIHDLHATMLYLLGIDHTRLSYPFGGRHMRLTDVYGDVAHKIIEG